MDDLQQLIDLITYAAKNIDTVDIKVDGLSPEYQALGEAVCAFLRQAQEEYRFVSKMADGDLSIAVPTRHNYLAGPSKDLYYKFKHLTWQANQVAKGDYNQTVDFMGAFSASFNYMVRELHNREQLIQKQAEEHLLAVDRQNRMLQRQMTRQITHYQSYRNYTESFHTFREQYKMMMGQVYELFSQGKYEEGRLLVAKINDLMGTDVDVNKQYSDHEFVDSALVDIAGYCQCKNIPFQAQVHIPTGFQLDAELTQRYLMNVSGLIFSLLDINEAYSQSVDLQSHQRDEWLSISLDYSSGALLPDDIEKMEGAYSETAGYIRQVQEIAAANGSLVSIHTEPHSFSFALHLNMVK